MLVFFPIVFYICILNALLIVEFLLLHYCRAGLDLIWNRWWCTIKVLTSNLDSLLNSWLKPYSHCLDPKSKLRFLSITHWFVSFLLKIFFWIFFLDNYLFDICNIFFHSKRSFSENTTWHTDVEFIESNNFFVRESSHNSPLVFRGFSRTRRPRIFEPGFAKPFAVRKTGTRGMYFFLSCYSRACLQLQYLQLPFFTVQGHTC